MLEAIDGCGRQQNTREGHFQIHNHRLNFMFSLDSQTLSACLPAKCGVV